MSTKKKSPNLYIIAGPNGAGKTTFAKEFLPHYAKCKNFVNADLIAQGLSPFSPEAAAMRAGRLLLEQIRLLVGKRSDFGFETTLSGVTHVSLLRKLRTQGYQIHLFFLKGIPNLFTRYRSLLDLWILFDNSGTKPRLVAREEVGELRVFDQKLFAKITEAVRR